MEDGMKWILVFFHIKYKGDWEKIFHALKTKEPVSPKAIKTTWELAKNSDTEYVVIIDNDYPERFKQMYYPPFVIEVPIYKGKILH